MESTFLEMSNSLISFSQQNRTFIFEHHFPCRTPDLGAALVFIQASLLQPPHNPPRAAGKRGKIKAIHTPGDLLLQNNWFLFAKNIITAKPRKQKGLSERGFLGLGQKVGQQSVGLVKNQTFLKRQLANN